MKNHYVVVNNKSYQFLETENISEIENGAYSVYGQAKTITEFVERIDIENNWSPYGYILRKILREKGSNEMTAYFYKLGEKF